MRKKIFLKNKQKEQENKVDRSEYGWEMGYGSDLEEKEDDDKELSLRLSSMEDGFKYKISVYSVALLNIGGGILRILVPSLNSHENRKQIIETIEESLFDIYPYTAFDY